MSSLFADTHNVVAILEKSNVAEGFKQIIDFLNGSYIHYALTVNPHIYISCIKKFWNTTSVKRSDDVTRLQALVDKKKIVISKDVIREILQLDDAEGVVCLPNEEIFAGLAQIGYEKPSTKQTFYKAFFPSQWKFLIHYILQSLSAKRTSWNEFSTAMASAVICLLKGQKFNFSKYIFDSLVRNENVAEDVTYVAIQSPPSHDIPSPSQEQSSPPQQPQSSPQAPPQGVEFPIHIQQILDVCSALTRRVENLENDKAAQKLEIIKLKARVKRLEKANKVKSSKLRRLKKVGASKRVESSDDMEDVFNQGRMIDDLDKDEGIELVKDANIAETEGRHAAEQAEKQAEIYHLDLDHSSKVLNVVTAASQVSATSATISAAKPSIPVVAPTVVAAYTRRRKGDKGKGILIETPKPMKKKDQIELDAEYARKLHEEINKDHEEINKDIDWDAAIDHNTVGYKMDFFKGMSYAEICPIFQARFDENMRFLFKSREEIKEEDQEIIKSINETPTKKAAKRRKLSEEAQEAEDLKKCLEVVDDEDDDVFIKATPLARKLILLVERRYPLLRFTLEQLVNVTKLQVEEESEMSLELLRFKRQQLQEYQQG
nr:hypothetical protein [Tanacetum cinerariifolium]